MNAAEHIRNRNAVPTAYIRQFAGKHVAWSEDGTAIIAAADSIPELIDAVDAKYPAGTEFLISYVPAGPYADPDPNPPAGTPLGHSANGAAP